MALTGQGSNDNIWREHQPPGYINPPYSECQTDSLLILRSAGGTHHEHRLVQISVLNSADP